MGTTPSLVTPVPLGRRQQPPVRGNIWLNADTAVGSTNNVGTGVHLDGELLAYPITQLANHYDVGYDGQGLQVNALAGRCVLCKVGIKFIDPFHSPSYLIWRPVLDPPPGAFERYDAQRGEASYAIVAGDGLVAPTGSDTCEAQDVTSRIGSSALQLLKDQSIRWARAVEPFSHQGAGSGFPLAVALSSTGDQIIDSITTDGIALSASADRVVCPDPQIPCDPGAPRLGSPHALNFVPVLTRMRRGVYVVGGVDPLSAEPTGEIWFTPLDGTAWARVAANLAPEKVLAATYLFSTDELVVLDETAEGLVRLWAVAAATGTTRLIASWPRHPVWELHWLVVDRDGGLLLVSSRPTAKPEQPHKKLGAGVRLCHFPPGNVGNAHTIAVGQPSVEVHLAHGDTLGPCAGHVIARFDLRSASGAELEGLETGSRPLVLAPVADGSGYTLITLAEPGTSKLRRERQAVLDLQAAAVERLGSYL